MKANLPLNQRRCPADVLLLIFEELSHTAPASLRSIRLVSRQFDALVNPIIYRHLKLNDALVKCFKIDEDTNVPSEVVDARKSVRCAVCAFTRRITINEAQDWVSVVHLLLSLDKFDHLEWSPWKMKGSCASNRHQIPQSILNSLAEHWPLAELSIDKGSSRFDLLDDIGPLPPTRLVSLKLKATVRDQVEHTLKNTLLKCHQLKSLHLLGAQPGFPFMVEEVEQSERFPAVQELFLQGSPYTSFWNWSRLTSLRLEKVFIVNFLQSVPPENLLQLRSLVTDGFYDKRTVDNAQVSVLHVI